MKNMQLVYRYISFFVDNTQYIRKMYCHKYIYKILMLQFKINNNNYIYI